MQQDMNANAPAWASIMAWETTGVGLKFLIHLQADGAISNSRVGC
jgi:hypothetical protein